MRRPRSWLVIATFMLVSIFLLALLPLVFLDNYLVPSLRKANDNIDLDRGTEISGKGEDEASSASVASAFVSSTLSPHSSATAGWSSPSCRCPGSSTEELNAALKRANRTVFLEMRKPRRNFHSNHWFHMGEYFLSLHKDTHLHSVVSHGDTILLMAHDAHFVRQLTPMSAFWLLLGINSGRDSGSGKPLHRVTRLEVYEPTWVYRERSSSSSASASGAATAPSPSPFNDVGERTARAHANARIHTHRDTTSEHIDSGSAGFGANRSESINIAAINANSQKTHERFGGLQAGDRDVWWGSFESFGPSFVYDATMPSSTDRFTSLDISRRAGARADYLEGGGGSGAGAGAGARAKNSPTRRRCHCGRYFPHLGAAPVASSHWFSSEQQVASLRANAAQVCAERSSRSGGSDASDSAGSVGDSNNFVSILSASSSDNSSSSSNNKIVRVGYPTLGEPNLLHTDVRTRPKGAASRFLLTVYERNNNRHFLALGEVLLALVRELGDAWEVRLVNHDEHMQPCVLHDTLRQTDVFLTTHGFQATAALLLPPGATLIEIFPYKYFKPSYMDLTKQLSLYHVWAQNAEPTSASREILRFFTQNWCMSINRCRSHARGDNVRITAEHADLVRSVLSQVAAGERAPPGPAATFLDRPDRRRE